MLLRDPVHGDIALSSRETAALDLPAVQRLRGIKQLGTAHLVYPGALHTRFDHSLGAAAVAKRILRNLAEGGLRIDSELAEAIAVAALLHDVTHVPYGHTLEDERRLFPRHDKGQRLERLLAGDLGQTLDALGLAALVAALLGQPSSVQVPPWASQLVSSTIDADLLDYLRRDAYFTGLAGRYDDRVFRQFVVVDDQLAIRLAKHGMERSDARSETMQLLRLRYFLTERVYYHHTKVAAGAMISKAVELAHEHGALDENELLRIDDGGLFARLRQVPSAAAPDDRIQALLRRLERRDLLKRAYVISARQLDEAARRSLVARYHEDQAHRHAAEGLLAGQLGCSTAEVIVYCPALSVMKEAAALVVTPDGVMPLNRYERSDSSEVEALERRYAQLWRFYVFAPRERARRAGVLAADLFGHANEHRAA